MGEVARLLWSTSGKGLKMRYRLAVVLSGLWLTVAHGATVMTVNYDLLTAVYNPFSGQLTLSENEQSSQLAFLWDTVTNNTIPGTLVLSDSDGFSLAVEAVISNPPGGDNLELTGSYRCADLDSTLAGPSVGGTLLNTPYGSDADGFAWGLSGSVLTISGNLNALAGVESLLLDPPESDAFTFLGQVGSFAIPADLRGRYRVGSVSSIQLTISRFANGAMIHSSNADELFIDAALNGGFVTNVATLQVRIFATSRADFDVDGDVDNDDRAIFEACATGPAIPYLASAPPGCPLIPDEEGVLSADLDADGDIDQQDFGYFQRCAAGANIISEPRCAD
ncbi:MAG: hypothetical protein AMXMBFR13_38550 [Phycisphaerae bacterium]